MGDPVQYIYYFLELCCLSMCKKIHKSRKLWYYCHSWIFRRGRGRGSKNGFDKGLGVQVGSSTTEDASKPTSEKLKEGDRDLLGKFVEEQLKNIKITNVEEQSKTEDASKPTSEKLKAGGQDLLGKFVEEQLKNIKITNVEEQLKTDPKITKVNNSCGQVVRNFEKGSKN